MSTWIVRPGQPPEGDMLRLPFGDAPDATQARSPAELRQQLKAQQPDATPEAIARLSERLWGYAHGIHADDIIAVPVGNEVRFAIARSGVAYAGGYVLPVQWFSRRVALWRFGRRRALFVSGENVCEVKNPQDRAAIRAYLPLPGNRFARWKWIMGLMMLLGMIRMAMQFLHK